jgi:hypothetical protein
MTSSVSPTASVAAAARGEEGTAVRSTGVASSASTSTGDRLNTASGASVGLSDTSSGTPSGVWGVPPATSSGTTSAATAGTVAPAAEATELATVATLGALGTGGGLEDGKMK